MSAVLAAYRADRLDVRVDLQYETFARLMVTDGQHASKVELGVDWRANEPIQMAIGPVLHPDDAVANKMAALYGRAFARDFIDVDAALQSGRYDREALLQLAERADAGFDRRIFADAVGHAGMLDADDFGNTARAIRNWTTFVPGSRAWRSELRGGRT